MIIPIDDPDDPRIAAYRAVRDRDLAGRAGSFIAEGEVVLRVLLGPSRFRAASLLLAEKRLGGLAPMLASLPDETPVYAASQAVLDAIVGFPIHRGILALGERGPALDPEALLAGLGSDALVLVLCAIANHDNLGGIFRNAAAFGVDAVFLDSDCCDPLYRKAIRVSVGASLVTPFAMLKPGTDAIDLLAAHGFEALALSPAGEGALADLPRPRRAAVLLGAEGPGLPAHMLERSRTVRIDMAPAWDSLNVATTSGIVLHHLARVMARPRAAP